MYAKMIAVLCASLFWSGCSRGPLNSLPRAQQDRLDVLTSFTLALSKRDFMAAATFLCPSDRALMVDSVGVIQSQYQERLQAMRLSTLLNNPAIEFERGKIKGICNILPVLAQAQASALDTSTNLDSVKSEPTTLKQPARKAPVDEALRKTAEAFFESVRSKKWNQALSYVNKEEEQEFVKGNGEVRDDARKRLAAIDTSSWNALSLKDGKLTGVVLLIPDAAP